MKEFDLHKCLPWVIVAFVFIAVAVFLFTIGSGLAASEEFRVLLDAPLELKNWHYALVVVLLVIK